jgi:hypothetical protein
VAYGVLTAVRLSLLSTLAEGGLARYSHGLALRLSDQVEGREIHFRDVVQKLWLARFQLAPGGVDAATLGVFLAMAAWIHSLCLLPFLWWRRGSAALIVLADLAVITCASAGVLAWYRLFPQHTYIHVLFIVRIVALPASYGFVTAAILTRFLTESRTRSILWAAAGCAAVALIAASLLLDAGLATVTEARFVGQPAVDSVACAPLGLKSDGKRDGLVEVWLHTRQVSPALALLRVPPRTYDPLFLRLERADPPGWWDTGSQLYILGISQNPGGALINRPDGTVLLPPGHLRRLWAHFCLDGHETASSSYVLRSEDAIVPVIAQD